MHQTIYDVVIIGSGPSGYTAAIYASRAGLKTALINGNFEAGGALMNTTMVENYPGFTDGILGPDLMEQMEEQAKKFGTIIIDDIAEKLTIDGMIKHIHTEEGESIKAKAIILSMGAEHRHLNVPGEEEYSGLGVSYCATCDASFFKDQDTAIIGGGDSALEEAMYTARFAKNVYIIHRRDSFRASQAMIDKLDRHNNIHILWNTTVQQINGDGNEVNSIDLYNSESKKQYSKNISGIFVAIGHLPRNTIVKEIIDCDENGYVKVKNDSTLTNIDGIFACGDLVDHKYRQAITAAGSGCKAALDAAEFLEK